MTGQRINDSKDWIAGAEELGTRMPRQYSCEKTAGDRKICTAQPGQNNRKRESGRDMQYRKEGTGQPENGSIDMTAGT
jgi:hypothetical protein